MSIGKGGGIIQLVRRGPGDTFEPASRQDNELQTTLESLKQCKDDLEHTNEVLRDSLGLEQDKGRHYLAKILNFLLPRSWFDKMPRGVQKIILEDSDALELIEGLMRRNITNTQATLQNVAKVAVQKKLEIEGVKRDIERAVEEGWDAKRLQTYLAQKADIQIMPEVSKMLDEKFNFLSEEERERRKQKLLQHLGNKVEGMEKLIELLRTVGESALEVFDHAVLQYNSYMTIYKPIAIIRDSALIMTDTNESMYAARDALVETIKRAASAFQVALEASAAVKRYAIASPEMNKFLEEKTLELRESLERVREEERQEALEASDQRALPEAARLADMPTPFHAGETVLVEASRRERPVASSAKAS